MSAWPLVLWRLVCSQGMCAEVVLFGIQRSGSKEVDSALVKRGACARGWMLLRNSWHCPSCWRAAVQRDGASPEVVRALEFRRDMLSIDVQVRAA